MYPDDFPSGYEPIHELGEGSMGSVWLAWHAAAQGHCAVKVLNLARDRRGSAERSFNREVRAMARLAHPNVVEVHDFGRTTKGSPYLAMEYVPGASLNSYARGAWSWPQLWTLIDGLLKGLGHAHARELVHRDLKPGNILLVPYAAGAGAVKLVDFGIALAERDAAQAQRRIEGTPAYIAPEAASGDVAAIGPWTDLYSLGVILFEILTGDVPFHGRHLLVKHQRSPVPRIDLREDIEAPEGLVTVVELLLAKSPTQRLRSVAEVRAALREHIGAMPDPEAFGPAPRLTSWDDEPSTHAADIRPLQGATGPALVHLRQPPIVGRRAAQTVLREAADAVLAGQGPRVVLIEGAAGMGKSRLAGWLREQLDESGAMRTMLMRSEPQTRTGGGLRQAVLRFVGAPTATRETADHLLAAALPDPDRRRNALAVLWPVSSFEGDARVKGAEWLIRDLAGERPLMIWADDVQWSPEGRALRLIHRLARRRQSMHMLFVVTLRPSERTTVLAARRALRGLPCTRLIRLSPLSPQILGPALESLAPLPEGLAAAASVKAAGNPLIALEAVRGFLESEGLATAPTDPVAVLRQRIDRATSGDDGEALRNALARATTLGRSFTVEPLAQLCAVGDPDQTGLDGSVDQVEALLETAAAAGLVREQGPGRWRFSHDLVRAQFKEICHALPDWKALNLACAALKRERLEADHTGIEVEVVARHLWEGGERQAALTLGIDGLNRLHGAGLMGHATSFVRRLLKWDDAAKLLSPRARAALHLRGSEAAEHAGQPEEAERHASAAVGLADRHDRPAMGARAASRLGMLRLRADDDGEAERWLWEAVRFARRADLPEARASTHMLLGSLYQYREQLDLALTAYQNGYEAALEGGLEDDALAARLAIARIDRLDGDLERAVEAFEELIEEAQQVGLEVLSLQARLELGLCAWTDDDPQAAHGIFEEVRRGARGNLFGFEFYASLGAAWALAAQGRWTEADLVLMQAEDLRFDVRLHDVEAESMRRSLRDLAVAHRRPDLVGRINTLNVMRRTTHDSAASSLSDMSSDLIPGPPDF